MAKAMQVSGAQTKREAVELGLKTLISMKSQEEILLLRGRLRWDGDLDSSRTDT